MDKKIPLYPLKFTPILKEKVWGGVKLAELFKKENQGPIGESWELSGVEENVSKVANGPLKNSLITNLIEEYKDDLVGGKVYQEFGNKFPLLFKFIDAHEDLSVQLHPDDHLASNRHSSFGKTEMWYIIQAEKDGRLILGFNQKMDEAIYKKSIASNSITNILHSETVKKGDVFFIAPGTVHAIGAGVVLAEIQQTSDITYRIYDWDRPDTSGKLRELHQDLAIEAINYNSLHAKVSYSDIENEIVLLKRSTYFETNKLRITKNISRDLSQIDSFIVYMCVDGAAILECATETIRITAGETILIPACIPHLQLKSKDATFLEVYIP